MSDKTTVCRTAVRLCKNCGIAACEECSDFCSALCMSLYLKDHKQRVCKVCGKTYYTQKGRSDWRCEKCIYEAKMRKPGRKEQPRARKGESIDEIIAEQRRIYEETGRWISYGQLVARKKG